MGRKKKPLPPGVHIAVMDKLLSAISDEPPETAPLAPLVVTALGASASPVAPRNPMQRFSPELADSIHDLYLSGMSLNKISNQDGMPCYATILRWYKDNREFRLLIDGARATRALVHEEKALEAAESPECKDDVPAANLKFNAHVWAAEINDPNRFGKKTTIQGDPNRPIVFQISTGVPEREGVKTIELNSDGTVKEDTCA